MNLPLLLQSCKVTMTMGS